MGGKAYEGSRRALGHNGSVIAAKQRRKERGWIGRVSGHHPALRKSGPGRCQAPEQRLSVGGARVGQVPPRCKPQLRLVSGWGETQEGRAIG